MNTTEIQQLLETAKLIVTTLAEEYTDPSGHDMAEIALIANVAAQIHCANLIAKAIYSTGPV